MVKQDLLCRSSNPLQQYYIGETSCPAEDFDVGPILENQSDIWPSVNYRFACVHIGIDPEAYLEALVGSRGSRPKLVFRF